MLNGGDSISGAGSITVASKATLTALGTDSFSGGTLTNSGSLNDLGNLTLASETDAPTTRAITVGNGSTADTLTRAPAPPSSMPVRLPSIKALECAGRSLTTAR